MTDQKKFDFKGLKTGDKLKYVRFGSNLYDAVVIENFIEEEILYVKIKCSWLTSYKELEPYNSSRLQLTKKA